jgi:hypothetical protein
MEKDYARADDIRTELNLNGVNTDDRTKTWRCSDGRSGSYTDTRGRMDSTISLGASYFNDRYGRSYNAAGGYNQVRAKICLATLLTHKIPLKPRNSILLYELSTAHLCFYSFHHIAGF